MNFACIQSSADCTEVATYSPRGGYARSLLCLCLVGGFLDNLRRNRSSGGMTTVITGKRPKRGGGAGEGGAKEKSATPLHELADEQPCVMGEVPEREGDGAEGENTDVRMRLHSPNTVCDLCHPLPMYVSAFKVVWL